jgi:hypothetical protein
MNEIRNLGFESPRKIKSINFVKNYYGNIGEEGKRKKNGQVL